MSKTFFEGAAKAVKLLATKAGDALDAADTTPAAGTAPAAKDAAPVTTDAASPAGSQEPTPTLVTPEPESAPAATTLADLEKQRDDLVALRNESRRIVSAGGEDELPLGQTLDSITLAREESDQRVAAAKKDVAQASKDLLSVLKKINESSAALAPVPEELPENPSPDRPPSRIDARSAADTRRRIREAETGRRELRSAGPTAVGKLSDRLRGKDLSVVDANSGQRFYPVEDIDPVFRMGKHGPDFFGAPPGQPKPVLGQVASKVYSGLAMLPRKMWEGSSAAEMSYRMKHAEPNSFLNPSTGRREPLPPSPLAPLQMEALGLDPAKPEDRRKWEEELVRQGHAHRDRPAGFYMPRKVNAYGNAPSLVPGGGRDPQAFTLAEEPFYSTASAYSDDAYQQAMGSGLMKTARGERPEVRDMSNIPIDERRSHYEGLSLDDRSARAVGELAGAQMLLTEIGADLDGIDNGRSYSSKIANPGVSAYYRKLQVKKSVTEDFVQQTKAILNQLRRQQYRVAVQAKVGPDDTKQF